MLTIVVQQWKHLGDKGDRKNKTIHPNFLAIKSSISACRQHPGVRIYTLGSPHGLTQNYAGRKEAQALGTCNTHAVKSTLRYDTVVNVYGTRQHKVYRNDGCL